MDRDVWSARVERWDGSLAIRLPSATVERFGLKAGDDVKLVSVGRRHPDSGQSADRVIALKRLRALRARMPGDFAFDRDEADER
jgi:antitoxin MazE